MFTLALIIPAGNSVEALPQTAALVEETTLTVPPGQITINSNNVSIVIVAPENGSGKRGRSSDSAVSGRINWPKMTALTAMPSLVVNALTRMVRLIRSFSWFRRSFFGTRTTESSG